MRTLIEKSVLLTVVLLLLGSGILDARAACSVEKMVGRWVYSEHGSHVQLGNAPFSEVGWFELRKDGTGRGEAFLNIGGQPVPPVVLNIIEVVINPETCAGRAAFMSEGDDTMRTVTFVANSKLTEFQFISTTGDLATLGKATRD